MLDSYIILSVYLGEMRDNTNNKKFLFNVAVQIFNFCNVKF